MKNPPQIPSGPTQSLNKPKTPRNRTLRAQIDEFADKLMKARPSSGLVDMISNNWGNPAFEEAVKELAPMRRIPSDLHPILTVKSSGGAKRAAYVKIVFAQAEKQFFPLTDDPACAGRLGFKDPKDFEAFIADIEAQKLGPRKSNHGVVDPDYAWGKSSPHQLPLLASALGLTPEGLRKRCRKLGIPVKLSPIKRRSSTIGPRGASILLKRQLKRPVNRKLGMAAKVAKAKKTTSALTGGRSSAALGLVNPKSCGIFGIVPLA